MKHADTLYGQRADFFNVQAGGTYSHHCSLNGEANGSKYDNKRHQIIQQPSSQ
jgi:hypothetical protein